MGDGCHPDSSGSNIELKPKIAKILIFNLIPKSCSLISEKCACKKKFVNGKNVVVPKFSIKSNFVLKFISESLI